MLCIIQKIELCTVWALTLLLSSHGTWIGWLSSSAQQNHSVQYAFKKKTTLQQTRHRCRAQHNMYRCMVCTVNCSKIVMDDTPASLFVCKFDPKYCNWFSVNTHREQLQQFWHYSVTPAAGKWKKLKWRKKKKPNIVIKYACLPFSSLSNSQLLATLFSVHSDPHFILCKFPYIVCSLNWYFIFTKRVSSMPSSITTHILSCMSRTHLVQSFHLTNEQSSIETKLTRSQSIKTDSAYNVLCCTVSGQCYLCCVCAVAVVAYLRAHVW